MANVGAFGAIAQTEGVVKNVEDQLDEKNHYHTREESHDSSTFDEKSNSAADRDEEVKHLARTFTQRSVHDHAGDYVNPFLGSDDPLLDPASGKFNARAWVKTLIGIKSRDPEKYPTRTAGVSYKNLSVHGFGTPTDYQKSFGNTPLELLSIMDKIRGKGKTKIQILRNFDGLVKSGEMLVVLGRPGSGCSTLLKTIAGENDGFFVDEASEINYQGIPKEVMHNDFRGECIYQAETDVHFPQLTVGQTLTFAAHCRAPANRIPGVTRDQYAEHMRDAIMAIFGLSHTINTKVGNDFIRGVSGGERKRVSIAEAALGQSPLQCWDNSTRGLDSATALEFVKTLKISTELGGCAAVVAIYQASQSIYDVFDKVAVLYEGRQIYFGNIHRAKQFFIEMGFECPARQTTADFLTSITSPLERIVRDGFENRTPRTPDEFAKAWLESEDRAQLMREIKQFEDDFPVGGAHLDAFRTSRKAQQAKGQRVKSPYTISVADQVKICMRRGFQRVAGDYSFIIAGSVGNSIMALIIGSVFYNLADNTSSLFSRGSLLFFAILLNAFSSQLEILTLYAQRPIVEKHAKYAFYHPFSEALSSMLCDLPNKLATCTCFSLVLYFLTNLRREPGAFFIFYLFSFSTIIAMSMLFRCIASLSRTLTQALVPSTILMLSLVIYTGFAIPVTYMKPWFRWINYLDPVAYGFEALMINEFRNREIPCSSFVPAGPAYADVLPDQRICTTTGSAAGSDTLDGNTFLRVNYQYSPDHLWRNLGIIWAFAIGLLAVYIVAAEFISSKKSKGEVLVFPRGKVPKIKNRSDSEGTPDARVTSEDMALARKTTTAAGGEAPPSILRQTAIFHWDSVNYDIKIKKEPRKLLDDVDGWVKPGTLTALMGVSGAGKTTLLDVLASRVTMGIVTGQMLVDGRQRDTGFQRKTGYVQQQDLHLETSTVREALEFSALLRQPNSVPKAEKLAYVDEVIAVLEMQSYADAVVGVPGEGLNVEQRKRLTIGVEMAAKPQLLLFLDEPTSGLDSQTAWSICALLRKLANNGQAILCTIHQPSAILFQTFDRLLFLASGGKTVYFGDIGESSKVLTSYFERNGSRACGEEENPAEWMLDVIGAAPGSLNTIDWPQTWTDSPERQAVKAHLRELKATLSKKEVETGDKESLREFAVSFQKQLVLVTTRVFEQYWRTPIYLYSKTVLCTATPLFIGFSFYDAGTSLQGMQNQLFAIFMIIVLYGSISQQIMPNFATQRALYEVRERPSKTYSWKVFIFSQIIVEIPWNSLMAVIAFISWYYPIGLWKNALHAIGGSQLNERSALMFLYIWLFLMYVSTFTDALIAGIDTPETASNIGNLMFSLCLIFCGVLASPSVFPKFWIFMYRVSPYTYLVDGLLSVGIGNALVQCTDVELLSFNPTAGDTCGTYMDDYINLYGGGGYLQDVNATSDCKFCTLSDTNSFLASLSSSYGHRWRNFGILFAFVAVNIVAAVFLYWLARVPKNKKIENEEIVSPPATVVNGE
ncbi:AtrD, ABC-transporter [Calycina marina]|uniref:AtrD, ABC-transporter n=1 Tax=Calycina marina TaxID=1763456 RepID=A0A9P7Z7F2_9HELO|nr:AtrD, ABC-transporter [Calycina marina]